MQLINGRVYFAVWSKRSRRRNAKQLELFQSQIIRSPSNNLGSICRTFTSQRLPHSVSNCSLETKRGPKPSAMVKVRLRLHYMFTYLGVLLICGCKLQEIYIFLMQQSILVVRVKSQTLWKLYSCTSLWNFGNDPPFRICYYFSKGSSLNIKTFPLLPTWYW